MSIKQEFFMQTKLMKKIISMILVVAMVFGNGTFAQLAPEVQAATETESSWEEDGYTFKKYVINADIDLAVQNGGEADNVKYSPTAQSYVIGRGRVYYVQYDLTKVIEALNEDASMDVYEAKINLTKQKSNGHTTELRYIPYNEWAESPSGTTYNTMEAAIEGGQFASDPLDTFATTGLSNNTVFSGNATTAITRENAAANGNKFTFSFTGNITSGNASGDENGLDVYSVACTTENYRPYIEITLTNMPKVEIDRKQNEARVDSAISSLIDSYSGMSLNKDISLPTSTLNVDVQWTSADPEALALIQYEDSVMTEIHPEDEEGDDRTVELTVTCSYGEGEARVVKEQVIKVSVMKQSSNIYPIEMVGIEEGSGNATNVKETAEVGRGRTVVMSFDISKVSVNSSAVYIHVENVSGNNNTTITSSVFTLPPDFDVATATHNKIFPDKLFETFNIEGGEFTGEVVTIPKKSASADLDVTRAVLKAKRAGQDIVVIGLAGDWRGTGTGQLATNRWMDASQKAYMFNETSTEAKIVSNALEKATAFDGQIVYKDLEVMTDTAAGAVIAWESDSEYAVIDGNMIRITRPTGDEDANVTFTVTVTYGDVSESATCSIIIPTEKNQVSPYLRGSLERMLDKASQLLDLATNSVYSEEELAVDFNEYLLKKEIPVYVADGTFTDPSTKEVFDLVKQSDVTVPRIDLSIEDEDRKLGQLSKEKYEALETAYEAGMAVYEAEDEANYSKETQNLLRAGYEFVKSGKTDDTLYTHKVTESELWTLPAVASDDTGVPADANGFNVGARRYEKVEILRGDELAYSSYRAYEEALVWKAYALLAIEPELYPQSAKDALMEKVSDAEEALLGEYYIMYAKSRQFFQSRPDEQIQRTTLYQDKSWCYEDFEYGLSPAINWYRKQSRAAEVSYFLRGGIDEGTMEFQLVTKTDASGNVNNDFSNSAWITSGRYNAGADGKTTDYRLTYVQYNLDAFTDIAPIYSAEMHTTNKLTGYYLGAWYLEENKDSSEYSPNEFNGEWIYSMTQRAQYSTVKVCVADAVLKRVYEGADKVTLSLRNDVDPAEASKSDVYSATGDCIDSRKGQMYVILEKINQKALADEIAAEVEEQRAFIADLKADGKVYTGDVSNAVAGAYPKAYVDAVEDVLDEIEDKQGAIGDYEMCALLTKLDDTVLAMKDKIVFATDIDAGNNIFFTEEETAALKEKIANDPELNRAYEEMKNIADRQDPEHMMQMRYDKLDNDPDTLNSRYKMWYGASNCNMSLTNSGLNVAKAYVTVTLPAKLNEEAGLGHAWFDKITMTTTSGREAEVPNNIYRYGASQTQPANWNAYVYDAKTGEELINLAKGTYIKAFQVFDENGNPVKDENNQDVYRKTPLNQNGQISDYVKWQQKVASLASEGSNSIYLCNPTDETYAVWQSDVFEFPVDDYTMAYQVKQDRKFNIGGVEVQFHYLDENENPVGESEVFWTDVVGNITGYTSSNMAYQCATVAYMITGEEKYAKIAKACMYTYLEEALLGAHSWENNIRHGRPAYGDVFGAVQNGRSGATLGTMYAVMKDVRLSNGAPLWTIEEKKQLVKTIQIFCGNLADVRDRTKLDVMTIADQISNWETDQNMGASMLAMAFGHDTGRVYTDEEVIAAGYVTTDGKADREALEEDITLEHAERYIHNTTHILTGCMLTSIRDDGAWPESFNYHAAMLEKLGSFAVGSRNQIGVDFFAMTRDYDDPETQAQYGQLSTLSKMLKYYAVTQAPRYVDGNAAMPAFGDGGSYAGSTYKYPGVYWSEMYKKYEEFKAEGDLERAEAYHELARDLYGCWNRAGRPRPQQANEENVMQFFFVDSEWPEDDQEYLEAYSENQKSNDYMKYFGTYIMRNNFDVMDERTEKYKESYVAIMAQPVATGHNHYDQGSFLLYADSVPLTADPGMDNYWSAGKTLMKSSNSHSTVQAVKDASSYADVTEYVTDTEFFTSDKMDKISMTMTYQSNVPGKTTRNYAFVKDGFEAHVVWDRVSGTSAGSRMNIALLTEEPLPKSFTGNKIVANGFSDVNLEITMLQGNVDSYTGGDEMKAVGGLTYRVGEANAIVDILRIANEGSDNYLYVMFPTNDMGTRGTLATEKIEVSTQRKIDGYKLSHNNGKHEVYVVVNDRMTDGVITLPEKTRLLNVEEGTKYEAGEEIAIKSGEMLLFSTNMSDEALETGTDEPKKAEPPAPTQPNQSTKPEGGAAGGAVAGGATNEETDVVKGNNSKVDLNAPGTTGTPNATVNTAAEEGIFQLDVTDGNTAYYSVNGSDYMKYTGPVSVVDGDKLVYFTVNDKTGVKTYGLSMTAKGGKEPKVPKKYGVKKGKKNKIRLYNAKGATDIKYKVAKKKIATVNANGKVKGKKVGKTKVTITFNLNGKSYKLKTLVKVKKKYKVALD
jgi:hypothetical protein